MPTASRFASVRPARSAWRPAARRLHDWVQPVVQKSLRRRGFGDARLLMAWEEIMGPELAAISLPWRVRRHKDGAVLQIKVQGLFALQLQHIAPEILARIHRLYGYPAFARLQFSSAPTQRR